MTDVSKTPRKVHQARLEEWSPDELKAHLCAVVDALVARKESPSVSPLDVALELFGGELEAFVLFGRAGHLDPPREDGKVAIAILQCKSEDPEIDVRIRKTAQEWVRKQHRDEGPLSRFSTTFRGAEVVRGVGMPIAQVETFVEEHAMDIFDATSDMWLVIEDLALADLDNVVEVKGFEAKELAVRYACARSSGNVDHRVLHVTGQVLVVATLNDL